MRFFRNARRAIFLTLGLLSACAAAGPSNGGDPIPRSSGVFGSYLSGRFALNHGDFDTAAADLLHALAITPDDPDLLRQTFVASVTVGRPEAVALARQIAGGNHADGPALPQGLPLGQIARLVLVDAAAKSGDWHQAVDRLRAIPREGIMNVLQPLLLAWALEGGSGPNGAGVDEARVTLRPFLTAREVRPIAALHAAMIDDVFGRPADAAANYRVTEAEARLQTPRTALILASWHARSGDPAGAERVLTQMAAAIPEAEITVPAMLTGLNRRPVASALDGMAEAYLTFAVALQREDGGELAMILARLALDVRPNLAAAKLLAAEIQANARRYDSALDLLDQAIQSNDPIVPILRLRRSTVLERMDRTDEAIREAERLGRDYPASPMPDIQLGDLLRVKHQWAPSIAAYDRVIGRIRTPAAEDWILYYSRGISFERSGQWARAEADFNEALRLSPDQPSVLNYLGYSWADMGRNLERAREMIQRALTRKPNDGAIIDSMGWVLFRQGHVDEALTYLERAVGLEAEDVSINDHLGDVLWAAGRKIEAHFQWRRALTLNPAPEDAAKLEAKIKAHPFGTVASGQ